MTSRYERPNDSQRHAICEIFSKRKRKLSIRLVLDVNTLLNMLDRFKENRESTPSLLCVDSQSVKLSSMMGADGGIDSHKGVNGRKREVVVDTGGRIWGVAVHAADIADGKGGVVAN